jgi:Mg-chelatase subunit ChlD
MNSSIVRGSLQAIAQDTNTTVAESFVQADVIILVDTSGSMGDSDSDTAEEGLYSRFSFGTGPSRYDRACSELRTLQEDLPGKIAVIAFSSAPEFCLAGIPPFLQGGTDMAKALKFVHVADDCGIRFILISDGQPQDKDKTLAQARKFKSKIDTIFIGRAGEPGEQFLRDLAAASGGQHIQTAQVRALSDNVQKLLVGA